MNRPIIEPVKLGNIFIAGEAVNVKLNAARRSLWTLHDAAGRLVRRGSASPNQLLDLSLPVGERGHYILSLQLEGQSHVHRTSLAVVAPFDLSNLETSPFGVGTHFGQLRGDAADPGASSRVSHEVIPLISRAGFKLQRDELPWHRVEPQRGTYAHPHAHQAYMAGCEQQGLKSLVILDYGNRHYDNGNAPHTDEGLDAYAAYAREVVRRYGPQLEAVEVWNEYNGSFSKGPAARRPEVYCEMLKRTYRAVKAERPELPVLAPAGVTLPYGWLERLFRLGALDYLDAVSVHPYIHPAPPDPAKNDLSAKLLKLNDLIERYSGGKGKPVQLTEIGWPTHRAGVSPRAQAHYAVRSLVMALAGGVDKIYWYELVNGGIDASKREQNFGLLRHPDDPMGAYTPKLAYVALAVLARQLSGARFAFRDALPDPFYSYCFTGAGSELRVLWAAKRAHQPQKGAVTVVAEHPLELTDMVGKVRTLEPQQGKIRLTLSESPIYLRGEVSVVADSNRHPGVLRRLTGGYRR